MQRGSRFKSIWTYCLCRTYTFINLAWAWDISLYTFSHDYLTYHTFMLWRVTLGEPMNPSPVFSIRITFQQLLHVVLFSVLSYSKNTKNIHHTLSFNCLVQLATLARLTPLLELLGAQVKFYLWCRTFNCCWIPVPPRIDTLVSHQGKTCCVLQTPTLGSPTRLGDFLLP